MGFLSGFTQSDAAITCSIQETAADGTQSTVAQITGGGNEGAITTMSTTSFTINPGSSYSAVVTSTVSPSQTPQIITAYGSMASGSVNYAGAYTMCVEDTPNGGDCDFNDAVISVSWTLNAG
jgi:hypothetical protein